MTATDVEAFQWRMQGHFVLTEDGPQKRGNQSEVDFLRAQMDAALMC